MTTQTMTRTEVDRMLESRAAEYGYSFRDLREMARDGSLAEPELRDLWIIWGDEPLRSENS